MDDAQCSLVPQKVLTGSVLYEYQPFGSFYGEGRSCCEMCTRDPECTHWSYTGYKGVAVKCIFYESVESEAIVEDSDEEHSGFTSGTSRPKATPTSPVSYYLGCGYAAGLEMDVCLDEGRDDMPLIAAPTMVAPQRATPGGERELPRCGSKGTEAKVGHGRWVRSDAVELGCPEVERVQTPETK